MRLILTFLAALICSTTSFAQNLDIPQDICIQVRQAARLAERSIADGPDTTCVEAEGCTLEVASETPMIYCTLPSGFRWLPAIPVGPDTLLWDHVVPCWDNYNCYSLSDDCMQECLETKAIYKTMYSALCTAAQAALCAVVQSHQSNFTGCPSFIVDLNNFASTYAIQFEALNNSFVNAMTNIWNGTTCD